MPARNNTPLTAEQQRLAADNVGLVFHLAGRMVTCMPAVRHMGFDDAVGAGMIGLCRAARGYDPNNTLGKDGNKAAFAGYAARAICCEIRNASTPRLRARRTGAYRQTTRLDPETARSLVDWHCLVDDARTVSAADEIECAFVDVYGAEATWMLDALKGWRGPVAYGRSVGLSRSAASDRLTAAKKKIRKALAERR